MFDHNDSKQVYDLADHNISLAKDYFNARNNYASTKYQLDLILATYLPKIRAHRSNVGYEMGMLFLMEMHPNSDEIKGLYKQLVESENRYLGLEKLIEAHAAKISATQSILKNQIKQGG